MFLRKLKLLFIDDEPDFVELIREFVARSGYEPVLACSGPEALRKVGAKSVEFHNGRGDFEKWAEESLHDEPLSDEFKEIRLSKARGEKLRTALAEAAEKRFTVLSRQTQAATQYF